MGLTSDSTGRGRRKASEAVLMVKKEPRINQDDCSSQGHLGSTGSKVMVKHEDSGVGMSSQSLEIDQLDWSSAWDPPQNQHYHHHHSHNHEHHRAQQPSHQHDGNAYQNILQMSTERSNNENSQLDSPPRRANETRVKSDVSPLSKCVSIRVFSLKGITKRFYLGSFQNFV